MIMLDSLLPSGKFGLIIRETYFYVVNCSKQGLLMAKVDLLGGNPPNTPRKEQRIMEWLKVLGMFELGALCGVIIMCIIQGGCYESQKKK